VKRDTVHDRATEVSAFSHGSAGGQSFSSTTRASVVFAQQAEIERIGFGGVVLFAAWQTRVTGTRSPTKA